MPTKKRKYFKKSENGKSEKVTSAFLLKFIDDKNALKTVGPFAKEDDAFEALSSYLRSGLCSWIVSYHG